MRNLKRIRMEKGLTLFKLSLASGIEASRISGYENKRQYINNARIETLCRLANSLGVKLWEILEGDAAERLKSVSEYDEKIIDARWDVPTIGKLRECEKYNQKEFAEMCGTTQAMISKYENYGVESARIDTLAVMCIFIGCHPCDLIDNKKIRDALRGVL